MNSQAQPLETLQDIRQMMERSSRFISLSGLSGIAAGCCALAGAWFAYREINDRSILLHGSGRDLNAGNSGNSLQEMFSSNLFLIAIATFVAAFVLAFLFTYIRSRKNNTPIWGPTSKRLIVNVAIPMIVGGIFLLKLIEAGLFGLIAPSCLVFYGLALVNASKYTLNDIRYLGFGQIILGLFNLWYIGYGIHFWAIGFGVLHILYGAIMWWKYEKA